MKSSDNPIQSISGDVKTAFERYEKGSISQKGFKEAITSKYGKDLPVELQRKLNDVGVSYSGILRGVNQMVKEHSSPKVARVGGKPSAGIHFPRYKRGDNVLHRSQPQIFFGSPVQTSSSSRPHNPRVEDSAVKASTDVKNQIMLNKTLLPASRKDVPTVQFDIGKDRHTDELRHLGTCYQERKKGPAENIQGNKSNGDIITWKQNGVQKDKEILLTSPKVTRTKPHPQMSDKNKGALDFQLQSRVEPEFSSHQKQQPPHMFTTTSEMNFPTDSSAKKNGIGKYHKATCNLLTWEPNNN